MKAPTLLTLVAALMLSVGCEAPEIDTAELEKERAATKAEREKEAKAAEAAKNEPLDMSGVANEPPPITSEPREFMPRDGKKGKLSRQAGGLGTIVSTKFTTANSLAKSSYIQALNLYWASEGNYPKTHEEFMEKIIKFNKIQLPELEAGIEYLYDPEDHILKVYRPETPTDSDSDTTEETE